MSHARKPVSLGSAPPEFPLGFPVCRRYDREMEGFCLVGGPFAAGRMAHERMAFDLGPSADLLPWLRGKAA